MPQQRTEPALDPVSAALRDSYDAVPYTSRAINVTHPDVLACAAVVRGLDAPRIESCRVLELGCASGGNLIPMAVSLPDAKFVGVDLAPAHIGRARETIAALGLPNIRVEAMSIADVGEDLGSFDYIVCHGVYSWVPPDVQDAILRICGRQLAPNGVAYVSYNTLPGWRLRSIVRDAITFHDRPELSPDVRVARGREVVQMLATGTAPVRTPYAALLHHELEMLGDAESAYFLHEELAPVNEALYFSEFVRRARAHGLEYLAEPHDGGAMSAIAPEVRATLAEWSGDAVEHEQYLDFIRNRTFRRTLLYRAADGPAGDPRREHMRSLLVSSNWHSPASEDADGPDASATTASDQRKGDEETFVSAERVAISTDDVVVRAALHAVHDARPARMSMAQLETEVRSRLGASARDDLAEYLAAAMLNASSLRLVNLHVAPLSCAISVGEFPQVSPYARLQAREGTMLTTLAHETIDPRPALRFLVRHADGAHDRTTLRALLDDAIIRGEVVGKGPEEAAELRTRSVVDAMLEAVCTAALLVD